MHLPVINGTVLERSALAFRSDQQIENARIERTGEHLESYETHNHTTHGGTRFMGAAAYFLCEGICMNGYALFQ